MTKQSNFFTREFKMAILSQIEAGVPVARVARENGLHPALIARWKKEYLEDPEKAFSGPGQPYKDQARVAELERMVGKLYAKNMFQKNLGNNERTRRGSEAEILSSPSLQENLSFLIYQSEGPIPDNHRFWVFSRRSAG